MKKDFEHFIMDMEKEDIVDFSYNKKPLDYDFVALYYNEPTQVKFKMDGKYRGGIAYKDYIIDGEYGKLLWIDDIVNEWETTNDKEDCIIELSWNNLDDAIIRGNY